jgi:hypothetical protein
MRRGGWRVKRIRAGERERKDNTFTQGEGLLGGEIGTTGPGRSVRKAEYKVAKLTPYG